MDVPYTKTEAPAGVQVLSPPVLVLVCATAVVFVVWMAGVLLLTPATQVLAIMLLLQLTLAWRPPVNSERSFRKVSHLIAVGVGSTIAIILAGITLMAVLDRLYNGGEATELLVPVTVIAALGAHWQYVKRSPFARHEAIATDGVRALRFCTYLHGGATITAWALTKASEWGWIGDYAEMARLDPKLAVAVMLSGLVGIMWWKLFR